MKHLILATILIWCFSNSVDAQTVIKAKSGNTRHVNWGKKPAIPEMGPPDMWTMPSMMCGGPFDIKASSTLASEGNFTFFAEHVSDDDPTTAWVEAKSDYGIGEYLDLGAWVPMGSGEISILNGYQYSASIWEANSRVKKMKISISEQDYCIVELADVMGVQTFHLPQALLEKLPATSLRFTIMEVYPGTKWKDTAISGIFSCGG